MPTEENEWIHQVVWYVNSIISIIQRDSTEVEDKQNLNGSLKWIEQIQNLIGRGLLVTFDFGFFSNFPNYLKFSELVEVEHW